MAFAFNTESPVLYFSPRPHVNPGPRNAREYILWPAWVYRIVAPMPVESKVNFIEKAVLGLCKAGIVKAGHIAARLHIHPELSMYVIKGLQDKGYIADNGLPTEKGEALFASETLEQTEMKAGYIFQDPFTYELWPWFAEGLNYIDTEKNNNGFVNLIFGSKGKPWQQKVHIHFPEDHKSPFQPDPKEILRKLRQYNRRLKLTETMEEYDEELFEYEAEESRLKRIDFIEEEPEPVFLTTYLYLPEDEKEGFNWYVCDPFGAGYSPLLRRAIERQRDTSKGLGSMLQRLLAGSIAGDADEHRLIFEQFKAEAALEAENRLTSAVRRFKVYSPLCEMEAALKEAELIGDDCAGQKLRSIFLEARRTLEMLFVDIKEVHPTKDVWKKLYSHGRPILDKAYIQNIYMEAFQKIGFDRFPDSILNVKPNIIRSVADYEDAWRLRPSVVAAALTAANQLDHPMYSAALKMPDLIEQIDNIAKIAGGAIHSDEDIRDFKAAEATVKTVYEIVALLLKPIMER